MGAHRLVGDTVTEVVKALAAALPELGNVGKDGSSHHGKYATLPALLDHVRPVLARHGLAVMQPSCPEGIRTWFVHSSGEIFDAGLYVYDPGKGAQAQGSAVSYARRYSLMAVLGIAGTDDDDGNAATREATRRPNAITPAQLKRIQTLMAEMPTDARLEYVSAVLQRPVSSSKDLTRPEAAAVIDALQGAGDGNV